MNMHRLKDRLSLRLRYLDMWLLDHRLRVCYNCKRTVFFKDTLPARSTTGIVVDFCKPCHRALFHPFSTHEKDK